MSSVVTKIAEPNTTHTYMIPSQIPSGITVNYQIMGRGGNGGHGSNTDGYLVSGGGGGSGEYVTGSFTTSHMD